MTPLFLNHLSLDNQFKDEDSFLESLLQTIKCLELAKKKNLAIFYSTDLYNREIYNKVIYRSIVDAHPKSSAEIQRFKRLLHELMSEEDFVQNNILDEALSKNGVLISFHEHDLFKNDSYFHNENEIRNSHLRHQLVKHLFELKEIHYPDNKPFKYEIHAEKDHAKHGDAHFHISKKQIDATVLIRNFEASPGTSIPRELKAAVDFAKKFQDDLIEIWDFFNPDKPYNPNPN